MFWKKWFSKKEPPLTVEEKLALQYSELDTRFLQHAFSSDMSFFSIVTVKPNVEEYIKLLEILSRKLDNDLQILSFEFAIETQTVSIRDFFTNKAGEYLDPVETFKVFSELVIKFLKAYTKSNNLVITGNGSSHALRNVTYSGPIIGNLNLILGELKSESQRYADSLQGRD